MGLPRTEACPAALIAPPGRTALTSTVPRVSVARTRPRAANSRRARGQAATANEQAACGNGAQQLLPPSVPHSQATSAARCPAGITEAGKPGRPRPRPPAARYDGAGPGRPGRRDRGQHARHRPQPPGPGPARAKNITLSRATGTAPAAARTATATAVSNALLYPGQAGRESLTVILRRGPRLAIVDDRGADLVSRLPGCDVRQADQDHPG